MKLQGEPQAEKAAVFAFRTFFDPIFVLITMAFICGYFFSVFFFWFQFGTG